MHITITLYSKKRTYTTLESTMRTRRTTTTEDGLDALSEIVKYITKNQNELVIGDIQFSDPKPLPKKEE